MNYLDKKIYFIGLYTPIDNTKFFNTYPKWHNNKESIEKIKESIYDYRGLTLNIENEDDRYSGMHAKCQFLNNKCNAGVECEKYNNLMVSNIEAMNNQISVYNNYLESLRESGSGSGSGSRSNSSRYGCPKTEDAPPSNVNATFSFL